MYAFSQLPIFHHHDYHNCDYYYQHHLSSSSSSSPPLTIIIIGRIESFTSFRSEAGPVDELGEWKGQEVIFTLQV